MAVSSLVGERLGTSMLEVLSGSTMGFDDIVGDTVGIGGKENGVALKICSCLMNVKGGGGTASKALGTGQEPSSNETTEPMD